MVDVIRSHRYKTAGRGRGVLGLRDLQPCRRPGETAAPGPGDADGMRKPQQKPTAARCGVSSAPPEGRNPEGEPRERSEVVVVVLYDYTANPGCPGGFAELTVKSGQIIELLGEREDNEHWWRVRDEDGNTGCVPASYVIKKEAQALPWLEMAALKNEMAERKERVKRLQQQKEAEEGRGCGPVPKVASKPYVSAYSKSGTIAAPGGKQYYCEVCVKQLNGPKPYQAHMASRAHKEELALRENDP